MATSDRYIYEIFVDSRFEARFHAEDEDDIVLFVELLKRMYPNSHIDLNIYEKTEVKTNDK